MLTSLRIAAWNSNGLQNHVQEITIFLKVNKIDILLISESHSTDRTVIKIPQHTVYYAHHPDGGAHAGSAIIIRNTINHNLQKPYITNKIQSTIIKLETFPWPMSIAAIYSPPRHNITLGEYQDFLLTLGSHFLVAGDWNAKHTAWGSRLITPKGRNLLQAIQQNSLNILSTGEPTYWPTDTTKIPDLLDFAITRGISSRNSGIDSSYDLSSDHSPIVITLSTSSICREPTLKLCSRSTNWEEFQSLIDASIRINHSLKEPHELEEAVEYFTKIVQNAAWQATPKIPKNTLETHNIPLYIKELVHDKRRARKNWQTTRNPQDKTRLNRLTHKLRTALQKDRNDTFKQYIAILSPSDHSIWKATKKFKSPTVPMPPIRRSDNNWARSNDEKANLFAEHLAQVFTLPATNNNLDDEIEDYINAPCQLSLPMEAFSPAEVKREINLTNSFKAPGYDLIVGQMLKHLPRKGIVFLTTIYNGMLRLCYFPIQWKFAHVIMIPKPGKPPTEATSYRPISLLPIMSKIFERLLLLKLNQIVPIQNLIPNHQFGFRQKHSTVQQCHRVVNEIMKSLEEKKLCASVFLDVQQAFDKVWHKGLLYKLKKHLPSQIYLLLKSYLQDRYFQVKTNNALSDYKTIKSGVPQGSVLGPYLYTIFTADIPTTEETIVATFADDTAIMSSHTDPVVATEKLQNHLNLIDNWFKKWKIKVNNTKSTQITFTNRRTTCPQVSINNAPIPIKNEVKYLGLHLDEKLTWKTHIKAKKQQLNMKLRQMYWLMGKRSQLALENKLTLYKAILKPVWTYGIELWGCSKPSNTKILQTFQSKTLRMIANAPWYISNQTIHDDFGIPFIKDIIRPHATRYNQRNAIHSNRLISELADRPVVERRLRRLWPEDLVVR